MWEATAETRTSAPPGAVWALWEDPTRWGDWNEQIAAAELAGPFEQGAIARIRFKHNPWALRFTITNLHRGHAFTDEARLPGARLGHDHRLEYDGEATTIVHRLYFDGRAAPLWGALMGRRMRAAVHTFGERERQLAEPEACTGRHEA